MELTEGFLLGGRVRYRQPAAGYRTGIEPVLLAASIPATAGMRVLEAGVGAGAGLLCLMARVPGLTTVGVEIDPATAALAWCNLGGQAGADIITGDIGALPGLPPFDHAYANPPWHDPRSTPSPSAGKQLAKQSGPTSLETWITCLAASLRSGGTVTTLVPASQAGRALAALQSAGCGTRALYPLWPRQGADAKLVLIRGAKTRRGPDRVAAGLVLHEPDGAYTPAAQAVLTGGAALIL